MYNCFSNCRILCAVLWLTMSTQQIGMQVLPSNKPDFQDLYTLDLSGSDTWYKLGLELGLSDSTLDGFKFKHTKPHLCKRAMFREWLKVCPAEKCTWSYLLQALTKVDPKAAAVVSETITSSQKQISSKVDQPHTAQFPLVSIGKGEGAWFDVSLKAFTSTQSLTPSIASKGSTDDSKEPSRTEFDYSPSRLSRDKHDVSNQDSSETRSVSGDEYQTAGEDDSLTIQHFSYQQDVEDMEQTVSLSFSAGNNPVGLRPTMFICYFYLYFFFTE